MPPKRNIPDGKAPQKRARTISEPPNSQNGPNTRLSCVKCISDANCPEEHKKSCLWRFMNLQNAAYSPDSPPMSSDPREDQPVKFNVRGLIYPYVRHGAAVRSRIHQNASRSVNPEALRPFYTEYDIYDAPSSFDASIDVLFHNVYKKIKILTFPQLLTYRNFLVYKRQIPEEYRVLHPTIEFRRHKSLYFDDGTAIEHKLDFWRLNRFDNIIKWLKGDSTQMKDAKADPGIWVAYLVFHVTPYTGHANILVFDNKDPQHVKVFLIDPNVDLIPNVSKVMQDICNANGAVWMGSPFITSDKRFQSIESLCPSTSADARGFCQSWTHFIAEAILKHQRYDDEFLTNLMSALSANKFAYRKFITDYLWSRMVQLHFILIDEHHQHHFDFEYYRRHIARHFRGKRIIALDTLPAMSSPKPQK